MPETSPEDRLRAIEERLEEVYASVEKTRTYLLFMLIAAAIGVVLPLIGLVFAIPAYLSTLESLSGL